MALFTTYLFGTFILGCVVNLTKSDQLKKIYLTLTFLIAFIITGFRGATVGIDTYPTIQLYRKVALFGTSGQLRSSEIEQGYVFLCRILSMITINPQILLIFTSVLICCAFCLVIKRYSKDYMMSCVVFVSTIFTVTMNVSRQYMALALVIFAILYAVEKKTKTTLVFLLGAVSIHYSALVFFPIWILSFPKFKFTTKKLLLIGGVSFLAVPLYMTLVSLLFSFFPQYARFMTSTKYTSTSEISYPYLFFLCMILLLEIWTIIPRKTKEGHSVTLQMANMRAGVESEKEYEREEVANYLFTVLFIEYIIIYLISRELWIASRLSYFFQFSLVIVIPNIIYRLKSQGASKYTTLLIKIVFLLYFINFGYRYFANDPHGVLPYVFCWDQ